MNRQPMQTSMATNEVFGELFLLPTYFAESTRIYLMLCTFEMICYATKVEAFFCLFPIQFICFLHITAACTENSECWGIKKKVFPTSFSHVFAEIAWYYSQIFPLCLILIDSATNATKMFVLFVQSNGIIIWNVHNVEGVS